MAKTKRVKPAEAAVAPPNIGVETIQGEDVSTEQTGAVLDLDSVPVIVGEEIKKFDVSKAAIAELKNQYGALIIKGPEQYRALFFIIKTKKMEEEITVDSIEIKKVKITTSNKGAQKLEIDYIKKMSNGEIRPVSEDFDALQHPDLKASFKTLRVHIGLMIGLIRIKEIKNILTPADEMVDPFTFHSYSIGGDDEDPGITLTGHVILWNKKAFNFVVPYYRFTEADDTRYKYMDDLMAKLDRVDSELKQYMSGAKRGTDPQGNLFEDPNAKVTKINVARPEGEDGEEAAEGWNVTPFDKEPGVTVDPEELLNHITQNEKPSE